MKLNQIDGEDDSLTQNIKWVLVYQCITTVALVLLIIISNGGLDELWHDELLSDSESLSGKLKAAFYGSILAIAGTLLNARSVLRASKFAADFGNAAMTPIFSGLLNKLVIVGGGIAFGLIYLGLNPIFVVGGYILVQLASALTLIRSKKQTKTI